LAPSATRFNSFRSSKNSLIWSRALRASHPRRAHPRARDSWCSRSRSISCRAQFRGSSHATAPRSSASAAQRQGRQSTRPNSIKAANFAAETRETRNANPSPLSQSKLPAPSTACSGCFSPRSTTNSRQPARGLSSSSRGLSSLILASLVTVSAFADPHLVRRAGVDSASPTLARAVLWKSLTHAQSLSKSHRTFFRLRMFAVLATQLVRAPQRCRLQESRHC